MPVSAVVSLGMICLYAVIASNQINKIEKQVLTITMLQHFCEATYFNVRHFLRVLACTYCIEYNTIRVIDTVVV